MGGHNGSMVISLDYLFSGLGSNPDMDRSPQLHPPQNWWPSLKNFFLFIQAIHAKKNENENEKEKDEW